MSAPVWSHPAFVGIAALVLERTGLVFGPGRRDEVERGARRAMRRAGVDDAGDYLAALGAARVPLEDLVTELTVHETYFFREPRQFDFVREHVLPTLALRGRGPRVHLIWSAGCASGEEAYSLAILMEQAGLARRTRVVGTDISRIVLARARGGRYNAWSLRGADARLIHRYFDVDGEELLLKAPIRERVTFEQSNLVASARRAPDAREHDLIFCRNVLIYFDRASVKSVARRLFSSLAPGGWLITSASDPPLNDHAPFETVVTEAGVFYRRGVAAQARRALRPGSAERRDETPTIPHALVAPARAVRTLVAEASGRDPGRGPAVDLGPRPGAGRDPEGPPAAGPDPDLVSRLDLGADLDPAHQALAARDAEDWRRAPWIAESPEADAALCALGVRAAAELHGSAEAERLCVTSLERHPLSSELHYLRAALLVELERYDEAVSAARRVIYLDRSMAVAHFLLGSLLRRRGDLAAAARSYRNARDLSAARPQAELVALGEGERAGHLAAAAGAQIDRLALGAPAR